MPPSHERSNQGTRESSGAESAYRSRYGSSFSMRSTLVSRSGPCSVTSASTSNQVFGLAKTDEEWAATLETALTATRRDDLQHGTSAAYVHGCVCSECREHQRRRMTKNRT